MSSANGNSRRKHDESRTSDDNKKDEVVPITGERQSSRPSTLAHAPTSSSLTSLSSTPPLTSSAHSTRDAGLDVKREGNARIIRSSDTEEDDELGSGSDSDSDSSLEDLTVVLARAERPAKSVSQAGSVNDENVDGLDNGSRRSTRLRNMQLARPVETKKTAKAAPAIPMANYKFSLGSLLDKASEEEAAEARLSAIKARVEAMSGPQSSKTALARKAREIDEKLLASVVSNEDGEDSNERAHRVIQAMERTDALRMDCVSHFFAEGWLPPAPQAFPVHALRKTGWQSILKSSTVSFRICLLTQTNNVTAPTKREFAFTSGFVETMCLHERLHIDVILWMFTEGMTALTFKQCTRHSNMLTSADSVHRSTQ